MSHRESDFNHLLCDSCYLHWNESRKEGKRKLCLGNKDNKCTLSIAKIVKKLEGLGKVNAAEQFTTVSYVLGWTSVDWLRYLIEGKEPVKEGKYSYLLR